MVAQHSRKEPQIEPNWSQGAAFAPEESVAEILRRTRKERGENLRKIAENLRIRLAYLLGLISKDEHEDLWAVNQIDEAFSRELGDIAFVDEPVCGLCLELRMPNKVLLMGEQHTPRRMFVFGVALLLRQLALRIEAAEKTSRTPPSSFSLIEVKR